MRKIVVVVLVLAALAAGVWWLRRDGGPTTGGAGAGGSAEANAPLAFVPADTPYVFANVEPLPAAVTTQWMQQFDVGAQLWQTQLAAAIAELESERPDADELKWLRAIDAELQGKTMQQVFETLGYDLQGRFAMYGIGLAPVVRVTLAAPDRFRAFLGRLEQAVGQPFPRATLEGVEYLQLAPPEAKLRGILALQGEHLVLTLAPLADDAALRELLGLQKPAKSLADGGALRAMNGELGYLPHGSGYFDTRAIVARLGAAPTALESAFLAALGVQKPSVDATCQAEYGALAAAVPRMSFGYTRMDASRMDMVARLETNAAIAADLRTLRAPMPGVAQAKDAPFNFGLSFKLGALPGVVGKWADAVAKSPWQCAQLLPLNEGFAQSRQQLANPMLFGIAPVFEGVHAIATRFELKDINQMPEFGGKLLIGSPNPAALVGMAKSFAPPLASLQLSADGKVQALPALPDVPPNLPMFAAMKGPVLALAVGAGEERDLADYLESDPAQQPLLVVGYSGALFAQFNRQVLAQAAATTSDPAEAQRQREAGEMVARMYEKIDRMEMRVEFGERGVELHQSATMR